MKRITAAKILFTITILFTALNLWAGGTAEATLESGNFYALGTTCTISIYDGTDKQFSEIEKLIVDIENRMSVNIEESEISAVNKAAGIEAVDVSEKTFDVITAGIHFSEISGGTFDISVGPLVSLWDIGGNGNSVPPEDNILKSLANIDYSKVEIQKKANGGSIYLPKTGMALEPGGIAKGFAADETAKYLIDSGVKSALINLGGNVLTICSKPDGSLWRIGVQNPDSSRGDYIGIVSVKDMAVVTSGKYERFFIDSNGMRYHHILSTVSGFPVENGIAQVSIMSSQSITADAMSTTVFSLGIEKGLDLANKMNDVEAIIVMENGEVFLSDGIKNSFSLTDKSFSIIE